MHSVHTIVVVALIAGFIAGLWLGIRLAENGAARHDMKRRWDGRQNWRKSDDS